MLLKLPRHSCNAATLHRGGGCEKVILHSQRLNSAKYFHTVPTIGYSLPIWSIKNRYRKTCCKAWKKEIKSPSCLTVKAAVFCTVLKELPICIHRRTEDKHTGVEAVRPARVWSSWQFFPVKQLIYIWDHLEYRTTDTDNATVIILAMGCYRLQSNKHKILKWKTLWQELAVKYTQCKVLLLHPPLCTQKVCMREHLDTPYTLSQLIKM